MTWRKTRDPYAIWVSEVMLQQTRVETVERYYGPFLARFPTVVALAAADEDAVLSAWSGLGYYRRARLLHRGARYVASSLGGTLPREGDALQEIPGIGPYTAGAIASIAFDRPEPLVDGNVARVLSRIDAVTEPREQVATASRHWDMARAILSQGSPRVLAQALMELGAMVCTPKAPACSACPLRRHCQAHRQGLTSTIPAVRKKVAQPVEAWWAPAVLWRGQLLFVQRSAAGLLAGLWCLPLVPWEEGHAPGAALAAALGVDLAGEPIVLPRVDHVFTHRIWHVHPCIVRVRRKPKPIERHVWSGVDDLPEGGIPSVTSKILARIAEGRNANHARV